MTNEIAENEKAKQQRRVDWVRHDLAECRQRLQETLNTAQRVLDDIGHIVHMMKRKEK
jgi:ferritin